MLKLNRLKEASGDEDRDLVTDIPSALGDTEGEFCIETVNRWIVDDNVPLRLVECETDAASVETVEDALRDPEEVRDEVNEGDSEKEMVSLRTDAVAANVGERDSDQVELRERLRITTDPDGVDE